MPTECQIILPTTYSSQLLIIDERSLCLLPDHSHIAPQSHLNFSPIAPRSNHASVYPPIFDTLEWMEMQTGIPISGLLNLYCRTYPLHHHLKT